MKSARDQRHDYPGQKRDDAGVEHGIGDKKMPRTNRRANGQIQYRCDGKDSEKSGNRHLPFRQPLHRLAREREPAFQAAEFLHAPAPFRQLDGKLIPLQVFRRRTKRRESLPVRELADDAVFARGAPRRGAHDVDAQLSGEVERALHELMQRPLEPRFAARLHRARDGDWPQAQLLPASCGSRLLLHDDPLDHGRMAYRWPS